MIIGITGTNSGGKGTIVQYLIQKKGFEHFSVRSFIEEEIAKRGLKNSRETLQEVANDLRSKYWPSYIVDRLYEIAQGSGKNVIIESLRCPGEVGSLKKKGRFYLFAIDADPKIRYERAKVRATYTDGGSFEQFIKDEQKEMSSRDPNKQNLSVCMELSSHKFLNNGTLEDLFEHVEKILCRIKKPEDPTFRISRDEYFMQIAAAASQRSTCLRHHVGAILVKDKMIISTGYNGAVRGVENCLELGCLRDELNIPSGTRHEICRAAHAEQNAIAQAAYNGINTKDSTIYCTHTPCTICTKIMTNSGVKEVVNYVDYPDEKSKEILKEAGIKLRKILRPDKEIIFKD
ncbi:AAA family ATPase [Candidatus Pacearchaeota archaeon]|nr:AAA family ATPase [Candidatus Pacearchaeota archaeon]